MNGSLERKQRQLDLNRRLGKLLASLRRKNHLKHQVVVSRMDFQRPLVSKMENGYHSLDAMEVVDYAEAIEIPPEELFNEIIEIVYEYDGRIR